MTRVSKRDMKVNKGVLPAAIALGVCCGGSDLAASNDEDAFSTESKYVIRMMARENYRDFVDNQMDMMRKAFPKFKDKMTVLEARVLDARKQRAKAATLLKKISKGSPYYRDAVLFQAELFHRSGKVEEAVKAFGGYLVTFSKKPESESVAREVKIAMQKCMTLMCRLGKTKEAQKVLGWYMKHIEPDGEPQEFRYTLAHNYIISAQEKVDAGKKPNKKELETALVILDGCLWVRDGYYALAVVEMSHIYCILGNWKKAISHTKLYAKVMYQLDAQYKGENIQRSPMAGLIYYYGRAYAGAGIMVARDRKDLKKGTKLIANGVNKWTKELLTKYGKSRYVEKVNLAKFKLNQEMKKLKFSKAQIDEALPGGGGGDSKIIFSQKFRAAVSFYQKKNYGESARLFQEALQATLIADDAPDAYKLLVMSLYKKSQASKKEMFSNNAIFWEIEAVADLAMEVYPPIKKPKTAKARKTNKTIADISKLMASIYLDKAKGLKDKPKQKEFMMKLKDAGNRWAKFYIMRNPQAPISCQWAFSIAEVKRTRLRNKRREIDKDRKNLKARALKIAETETEIRNLIPEYEWIIANYGSQKYAVTSRNVIGALYNLLKEYDAAAEYWLQYADLESNPKVDKNAIRLLAGKVLINSSNPENAINVFKKLMKSLEGESAKKKAKKSWKNTYEEAAVYIGLAYNGAGETFRGKLNAAASAQSVQKGVKRDAEREIREINRQLSKDSGLLKADLALIARLDQQVTPLKLYNPKRKADQTINPGDDKATIAQKNKDWNLIRVANYNGDPQSGLPYVKTQRGIIKQAAEKFSAQKTSFAEEVKKVEKVIAETSDAAKKLEKKLSAVKKEVDAKRGYLADDMKSYKAAEATFEACKLKYKQNKVAFRKEKDTTKTAKLYDEGKDLARLLKKAQAEYDKQLDRYETVIVKVANKVKLKEDVLLGLQTEYSKLKRKRGALEGKKAYFLQLQAVCDAGLKKSELDQRIQDYEEKSNAGIYDLKNKAKYEAKKKEFGYAAVVKAYKDSIKLSQVKFDARTHIAEGYAKEDKAKLEKKAVAATKEIDAVIASVSDARTNFNARKEQAMAEFKKFLTRFPKSDFRELVFYKMASIKYNQEKYQEALPYYQQLGKSYPRGDYGKLAVVKEGQLYLKLNLWEKAVKTLTVALNSRPDDFSDPVLLNIIKRLNEEYDKNDPKKASMPELAKLTGRILETRLRNTKDPKKIASRKKRIWSSLGEAYYATKAYGKALTYYEKYVKEFPRRTKSLFQIKFKMALAYRDKKNPELDKASAMFRDLGKNRKILPDYMKLQLTFEDTLIKAKGSTEDKKSSAGMLELLLDDVESSTDQELLPIYEEIFDRVVTLYKELNDSDKVSTLSARYRKKFPNGMYVKTIGN